MSLITAATNPSAQGIVKIFNFSAIGDGDTFAGPPAPKAFWAVSTADPTTNTSAGINVAHSAGTYTFYPGVAALTGTLFVIE
jgi:hypothetical protein